MNSLLVHAEVGDTLFDVPVPWYQGMVVGHHGLVDQQVATVREKGVKVYRYVNLWTAPDTGWVGRGNPLHDYMDQMVREGNLYFRDRNGNPAETPDFPEFGPRTIINWGVASQQQIVGFVQFLLSLDTGPLFTDVVYYRPDWWWFGPNGPNFSQISILVLLRYEIAMRQLLGLLQLYREVIINGTHEAIGQLYLENSQAHWAEHLALWNQRNIFSVEASHIPACQEAVNLWLSKKDRWLAFNARGNGIPLRDAAYELAVTTRNRLQGGDAQAPEEVADVTT